MNYNFEEYKNILKKLLSEERYIHSLNVADLSYELAKIHHLDAEKAKVAGLLHDITKELSEDEQDDLFRKYNDLDKINSPKKVKHSYSAKYYLIEHLNIIDEDILDAVYNHTVINSDKPISKIIYIADKREVGRNINDGVIEETMKDLDKGFRMMLDINNDYVKRKIENERH